MLFGYSDFSLCSFLPQPTRKKFLSYKHKASKQTINELPIKSNEQLRIDHTKRFLGLLKSNDEKTAVAEVLRLHMSLLKSEVQRELQALREWDRLMSDLEQQTNVISFDNLREILRGYEY